MFDGEAHEGEYLLEGEGLRRRGTVGQQGERDVGGDLAGVDEVQEFLEHGRFDIHRDLGGSCGHIAGALLLVLLLSLLASFLLLRVLVNHTGQRRAAVLQDERVRMEVGAFLADGEGNICQYLSLQQFAHIIAQCFFRVRII